MGELGFIDVEADGRCRSVMELRAETCTPRFDFQAKLLTVKSAKRILLQYRAGRGRRRQTVLLDDRRGEAVSLHSRRLRSVET